MKILLEIALAVASGGGIAAMIGAFKFYQKMKLKRAQYDMGLVIERVSDIFQALNAIIVNTQACRVVVAQIKNGGTIPCVGKPLHASIVYEAFNAGESPIHQTWQEQPIDSSQLQHLLKLSQEKEIELVVDKAPDGIWKRAAIRHQLKHCQLKEILSIPGQYFYLGIAFKDEIPLGPQEYDVIREAYQTIRRTFHAQYKHG